MKRFAHAALALMCAATFARADWVMVQKQTAEGQEKIVTTKIKGEQVRVDQGKETTLILDASGTTMMVHAEKVIMKAAPAALESLADAAASKMAEPTRQPAARLVAIGQKEKVGEWDTEIFIWEGSRGKGRFWVTKSIPKHAELNAIIERLLGKATGNAMAGMEPPASDFDGMPVKSEQVIMGETSITLLQSVKEQDVDAKEFVPAEGYTEVKLPASPQ